MAGDWASFLTHSLTQTFLYLQSPFPTICTLFPSNTSLLFESGVVNYCTHGGVHGRGASCGHNQSALPWNDCRIGQSTTKSHWFCSRKEPPSFSLSLDFEQRDSHFLAFDFWSQLFPFSYLGKAVIQKEEEGAHSQNYVTLQSRKVPVKCVYYTNWGTTVCKTGRLGISQWLAWPWKLEQSNRYGVRFNSTKCRVMN